MKWKKEESIIFKKRGDLLTFSTAFINANDEYAPIIEDFNEENFMVIDENSVYMQDWCDLRQFNCCNNILDTIKAIAKILKSKKEFSIEAELEKKPVVKIKNLIFTETDFSGIIVYEKEELDLKVQPIKYIWIDESICSNRVWELDKAFTFAVHLQREIYLIEKENFKNPMFLSIDKDIIEYINKQ